MKIQKKEHDKYLILDIETGETFSPAEFEKIRSDNYWEKAHAHPMAKFIESGGQSSSLVLAYLLKKKDSGNKIVETIKSIHQATGISESLISKVMKNLIISQCIKKINNGAYMMNPEIIMYGSVTRGSIMKREWSKLK